MTKRLIKVWQIILEILFPSICLSCRIYLRDKAGREDLLCSQCFGSIKIYSNIFMPDPRFDLIALGPYENKALKELIHYFKYNGFLGAQAPLEKLIIKWLNANRELVSIILGSRSLVVPIPLHKSRLRKRGFNQAELIAGILSKHLNLPLEKNLLERIRDTKSQIKMSGIKERRENVKNSIDIRWGRGSLLSQYQGVILVDDIYTSGSTVKDAVKALRRAGAKNITAFVVAKA